MPKANAFKYQLARDIVKRGAWVVDADAGRVYGRGGREIGGLNAIGYIRLRIENPRKPGHVLTVLAHRVIWEAVHGPIADDSLVINHKDGDKANNRIANLELVTQRQNLQHAVDTGLNPRITGERHHRTTLTAPQIRAMYEAAWSGPRGIGARLAEQYGVNAAFVSAVKHGQRWADVTRHGQMDELSGAQA